VPNVLQVLFPLLALVPRKEVRNDAASEIIAPLLGGEGEENPEDLMCQQQASAQANENFGELPGKISLMHIGSAKKARDEEAWEKMEGFKADLEMDL
jgi:hypothetical protein